MESADWQIFYMILILEKEQKNNNIETHVLRSRFVIRVSKNVVNCGLEIVENMIWKSHGI